MCARSKIPLSLTLTLIKLGVKKTMRHKNKKTKKTKNRFS